MKGTTHKRYLMGVLCTLILAFILFAPNVVEAAELTATANKTKEFTGSENGEVIYLTLSGAGTNTKIMGKPTWITYTGSGAKYTLKTTKNTSTSSRKADFVVQDGKKIYTLRITQKGAPTSVTVKFDNNGGKGKVPNKSYKIGKTYGKLPAGSTPPTGKKFAGWYTKPSGGTKITEKSKVSASTTTLYAHYTNKSYTVKFDSRGGTGVSSKTVTYGANYGKLTTPKKTGYNFQGWYTSAIGGKKVTEKTKMSTAVGHTLYAHWTPATYTITFDSCGGSAVPSRNVAFNSNYGELRIPTRAGYTFLGWFTAAKGGTQITSSSTLTKAAKQTLYAQWKGGSITVHFDNNGGHGDVPNKGYTVESKYNSLPAGTTGPKGYVFDGWYTARTGGTKITKDSIVSAEYTTLYAQYKPNTYTLSFNSVGGSAVSSRNVKYDSKYGELPVPKKYGYKFEGWFTAEKGGTEITENSIVSFASNHTLYAHWKYNMVYVRFDPNGGKGEETGQEYEIGSKYGSFPTGPKSSYTYKKFDGWYTEKEGGTKVTTSTIVSTDHIKLYAHYSYDPDAFFKENPRYIPANSAKQIPYNKGIENAKKITMKQYEDLFSNRSSKYNKQNYKTINYIRDVHDRVVCLRILVDGAGVVTPEATALFRNYLYGNGERYIYSASNYVFDGTVGTSEYNTVTNILMRQMERYLQKGKKLTFVDKDSSKNRISFTRAGWKDLNGFLAVKEGSTGVSGSCTFDGNVYEMDLYFYVQDYYDFYYADGDPNSQADYDLGGVYLDELAFLVPFGAAKPFESCAIFHTKIRWYKGQNVNIMTPVTHLNPKSKMAEVTQLSY